MTINQHNTRFLSPTDQKCAVSSTYWQFLYYRPPGKFRQTPVHRRGISLKIGNQDIDVCRYTYINITSIIDMDFAVSIGNTKIM